MHLLGYLNYEIKIYLKASLKENLSSLILSNPWTVKPIKFSLTLKLLHRSQVTFTLLASDKILIMLSFISLKALSAYFFIVLSQGSCMVGFISWIISLNSAFCPRSHRAPVDSSIRRNLCLITSSCSQRWQMNFRYFNSFTQNQEKISAKIYKLALESKTQVSCSHDAHTKKPKTLQ